MGKSEKLGKPLSPSSSSSSSFLSFLRSLLTSLPAVTPTYSRLRTTQTNNKPRCEPQRRVNNDQDTTKGVTHDMKDSKISAKFNVVLIIGIAVLLLFTLMSIALSVTTYSQLTSQQPRTLQQLNNQVSELMKIITTQYNISQNDIKLVQRQLAATQTNISNTLTQLDNKFSDSIISVLHPQSYCGPGPWYRVAYLNMSNPAEQCPSAWREYNSGGIRACGRPASASGSCPGVQYSNCNQYTRVCGRIIGYQVASPDAFESDSDQSVDGITITRDTQHIWSYVAGLTENDTSIYFRSTCPCSNTDGQARDPPSSIGNKYYCESGNSMSGFILGHLYIEDKLWDDQQCEGTCCTGTNSPPWFSIQLPSPTTDAIEVSICCNQGTDDEDIPVELIELYVQ